MFASSPADGVALPVNNRQQVQDGELRIEPVTRQDGGQYSCTAIDKKGRKDTQTALITIRGDTDKDVYM